MPSWERVRPWLIPPSSLRAAFRAVPSLPALSSSLDTESTARCAPRPPWLGGGARRGGWHRGDIPVVSPHQDLLKHTPEDHPDHPFLIDAQRNIKQVAERINKGMKSAEEVERNARIVQEIESHIEGMEDVRMGGLGVGSWVAVGEGDGGASCGELGTPSLAKPFCSPAAPKGAAPTPSTKCQWGGPFLLPQNEPFLLFMG